MFVTPILNQDTQDQVDRAVAQFKDADKWKQWGLHTLRDQGACILLDGPPGCGKTTVANYIALRIRKKGIKVLDFAEFGSQVPGENARQIKRLFREAKDNGGMTLFLDECEAVLWSRDRIAGSNTWMLEVIDTLLAEISAYKYLVLLGTNRADMLDAAIMRRLLARITIGLPNFDSLVKLWKQKLPSKFPLKLTDKHINAFANQMIGMTGNTVERIILNVGSTAIVAKRLPTSEDVNTEIEREKALLS